MLVCLSVCLSLKLSPSIDCIRLHLLIIGARPFLQVDPDKAFAVQIKHEESVLTGSVAYMQCAVLFSSSNGERRIRYTTAAAACDSDQ